MNDENSNFKVNAYEMWMKVANRNKAKSVSRTNSVTSDQGNRFFNSRGKTQKNHN